MDNMPRKSPGKFADHAYLSRYHGAGFVAAESVATLHAQKSANAPCVIGWRSDERLIVGLQIKRTHTLTFSLYSTHRNPYPEQH